MKRILKITPLFILFAIGFSTCEKFEKDTPVAIKKLIRESYHFAYTKVIEYEYNNSLVYLFLSENCIDCFTYIYDEKGNLICRSGGIDGLTGGERCTDFYEKAIEKRIIWTKKE
jgi:hypothetical protein